MYPPNSRDNCIVRRLPEPAKKVRDYYSIIDAATLEKEALSDVKPGAKNEVAITAGTKCRCV